MLDLTPLWKKYDSEQNISEEMWRIYKNDSHPSPIAHKFIANTLSKMIVQLILDDPKS